MPVIGYTWGKRALFRKDDFVYDRESDLYTCPAGQILRNTGARKKLRLTRYVADPKACNACSLKSRCTEGKSGRAVNRNSDEEYFEKVKGYYGLEAYKKAMRKRKVWIEPVFAEAKQWHGMERMSLRMLERVIREILVTAAGQNIKRASLRPDPTHRVSQHAVGIPYCESVNDGCTGAARGRLGRCMAK